MKNRKKYYLVRKDFVSSSTGRTDDSSAEILYDSYILETLKELLKKEVKDEIHYTNVIFKDEEGWAIPLIELGDYALIIKVNKWTDNIKTRIIVYSITEQWV